MSNCPSCNNPIEENQVICLNCGIQIKPLKIEGRTYNNSKKLCIIVVIFIIAMMVTGSPQSLHFQFDS